MPQEKREHPKEKAGFHARSKHRNRYDFKALIETYPALKAFVKLNEYQDESVDFFDPAAVRALNTALLLHHYKIDFWEIPKDFLCPPIPGRAEYIHQVADLLGDRDEVTIPKGSGVRVLDIGTGASCIYPIIGNKEYGWTFVGSEIDPKSIESANNILKSNPSLQGKIEIRLQNNPKEYFAGIIQKGEKFDVTICNPPFNSSLEEAQAGTIRKISNLKNKKIKQPVLNFGGQGNELWCEGGEEAFVTGLIKQSRNYSSSCLWFTTQVSKQSNLKSAYDTLKTSGAKKVITIPLSQGNKSSRILAWTFLSKHYQQEWKAMRWGEVD
jgi:23S rRNA (adenine1618-N6)-methyltransferase